MRTSSASIIHFSIRSTPPRRPAAQIPKPANVTNAIGGTCQSGLASVRPNRSPAAAASAPEKAPATASAKYETIHPETVV